MLFMTLSFIFLQRHLSGLCSISRLSGDKLSDSDAMSMKNRTEKDEFYDLKIREEK